ncbi:MAG: hypothetical protein AAB391_02355 [Patescibacteria group bacterium]
MDPRRLKLPDLIPSILDADLSEGIGKLFERGITITAHTNQGVAMSHGKNNPFYYHDVRKMYLRWKAAVRKFLDRDKEAFEDEREIFSETDSVCSFPLTYEEPNFPNLEGDKELFNINKETRAKLKVLRSVRKKIVERDSCDTGIAPNGIFFDPEKSLLYIKGNTIKIRKFSNQYHVLRVIFEDTKEVGEEWFFSEIAERLGGGKQDEKRCYNAIYQIKIKLLKYSLDWAFITTRQSVRIPKKLLS